MMKLLINYYYYYFTVIEVASQMGNNYEEHGNK